MFGQLVPLGCRAAVLLPAGSFAVADGKCPSFPQQQKTCWRTKGKNCFFQGLWGVQGSEEEKYGIGKGNVPSGEIAFPFPAWGSLHYSCLGQFCTRTVGSKKK